MSDGALTTAQKNVFACYEATIERGLASFMEVGIALMRIRDDRLYRETHERFDDYCKDRWQISPSRAYQLIDGAEAARTVSTIVETKPANESQARPLTLLESPSEQRAAWKEAVNTAPKNEETGEPIITARHVEQVVRERLGDGVPKAKAGGPTQWDKLAELNLKGRAYFEQIVAERRDNQRSEAVLNAYEELDRLIASYRKSVSRIGA